MTMKFKLTAVILLLVSILLTGCYDRREIDETAYIVALGIDNSDGGNFDYTFQFSKPLAIMDKGEGGENTGKKNSESQSETKNSTVSILTISAPDFYIAKNMTNNYLSKNVDMSHLKLIVFSAEVDALSLENHSRLLLRERQVRPHTAIAVAATSASAYLEGVNPELESNTSKYYELMALRSNNVYAPAKRLHDFVDQLTTGTGDTVLPIAVNGSMQKHFPSLSQTPGWVSVNNSRMPSEHSVLYGMAVFKNGQLRSAMDGDDAMIFNILNRSIEDCTITLSNKYNPSQTLSFRLIVPQKMSAKISLKKKEVKIHQDFRLQYLGRALPDGFYSLSQLQNYAQEVISQRITDFFTVISQTQSSDIMQLRNCIRKDFSTWEQWEAFDWNSFYKNARFVVSVNIFEEV